MACRWILFDHRTWRGIYQQCTCFPLPSIPFLNYSYASSSSSQLGTIIQTVPSQSPSLFSPTPSPAGLPSTHVTTIALTSTVARLLAGSLSDLFAPTPVHHLSQDPENGEATTTYTESRRYTVSRLAFLVPSAFLLSIGFLLLSTTFPLKVPQLFYIISALVGIGYGCSFALVPIIINVVWGVENFATNWSIVAMFPAVGAAVWGILYSHEYQKAAAGAGNGEGSEQCFGWACYGFWAVCCLVSVWVAILAWGLAWRGWKRRGVMV